MTRKELQTAAANMERWLDALGYDITVKPYVMYDGRIGYGFYYRIGMSLIFATGTGDNDSIYKRLYCYFQIIASNPKSYI